MRIVCVSASNIRHAGEGSTSLRACRLLGELAMEFTDSALEVDILPLMEYDLQPCTGCGACLRQDRCAVDDAFNRAYAMLTAADAVFIVSAHYAPIPAKLCMLLEKVEQLAFLKRFRDETYRSPLYGRPVGIVAHGGGTQEIIEYYKSPVIDAIWNALSYPVEMDIVGVGDDWPRGVAFPVKSVSRSADSPFPVQEYDWDDIRGRLRPLACNVVERAGQRTQQLKQIESAAI